MKRVKLYQTLEDRCNPDYIEEHGPFACRRNDRWLACGAYFWENDIQQAYEWGDNYPNGFVICESEYDADNKNYYDLVTGEHYEELKRCQRLLKKKSKEDATLPQIIDFIMSEKQFPYNAIRYAFVMEEENPIIVSAKYHAILAPVRSIQICVVKDGFLLDGKYKIIFPPEYVL